eukprot:1399759-Amphidinium_carterae.1
MALLAVLAAHHIHLLQPLPTREVKRSAPAPSCWRAHVHAEWSSSGHEGPAELKGCPHTSMLQQDPFSRVSSSGANLTSSMCFPKVDNGYNTLHYTKLCNLGRAVLTAQALHRRQHL